jgi:hypothetical protein
MMKLITETAVCWSKFNHGILHLLSPCGETMRWRRQWRQHFVSFSNPNNFIKSAQNFIKLGQKLFMVKERSSLLLFKEFFPQQIKVIITNNSTYNWQLP